MDSQQGRLAAAQARALAVEQEIRLLNAGADAMLAYEASKIKQMPRRWMIMVLLLVVCMFYAFEQRLRTLATMNFVAFLLVWRNLFGKGSVFTSMVIGSVMIFISLYFG